MEQPPKSIWGCIGDAVERSFGTLFLGVLYLWLSPGIEFTVLAIYLLYPTVACLLANLYLFFRPQANICERAFCGILYACAEMANSVMAVITVVPIAFAAMILGFPNLFTNGPPYLLAGIAFAVGIAGTIFHLWDSVKLFIEATKNNRT